MMLKKIAVAAIAILITSSPPVFEANILFLLQFLLIFPSHFDDMMPYRFGVLRGA
jgi:hypothetical protein